jgi:hypothetical protein
MPLPEARPRPSALSPDDVSFAKFKGVVNTRSHKEINTDGLIMAVNLEVDNDGILMRRDGTSLFLAGNFRGAYANNNQNFLFGVVGTDVVRVNPDATTTILKSGLSLYDPPGGFSWSEDPSNFVCYTNGTDSGMIRQGIDWVPMGIDTPVLNSVALVSSGTRQVLQFHIGAKYTTNQFRIFTTYVAADGRESAPSAIFPITAPPESALVVINVTPKYKYTNVYACPPGGKEYMLVGTFATQNMTVTVNQLNATGGFVYPYTVAVEAYPNEAKQIKHWGGRLYAAEYVQQVGMSIVWPSLPLQYHLFNKAEDFFVVIGEVLLMLDTPKALIVATDNQIYSWDGTTLTELTQYGVVLGSCGDVADDGTAYFWTVRGMAKAMPYELFTEESFSGDPGVFNHARLFYSRGYVKLLASTMSGNPAFNQRIER